MLEHSFGHLVHVQYKAWDVFMSSAVADWNDFSMCRRALFAIIRGAMFIRDRANSLQQATGVVLILGFTGISIIIIITAATLALVAKHRRRAHIVAESVPHHTPSHLCLYLCLAVVRHGGGIAVFCSLRISLAQSTCRPSDFVAISLRLLSFHASAMSFTGGAP